MTPFREVTRIEIIGLDGGRELVRYGMPGITVDFQDAGRTLKIFAGAWSMEDRHAPRPDEQPEDDQHDPQDQGAAHQHDDAEDHQDHGEDPEQRHGEGVPRS